MAYVGNLPCRTSLSGRAQDSAPMNADRFETGYRVDGSAPPY